MSAEFVLILLINTKYLIPLTNTKDTVPQFWHVKPDNSLTKVY